MIAETKSERVSFAGSSGAQLAAVLESPVAGRPRGHALFAHCFTCTKDIFAARHVARTLAARGIAVLRFDFTGLGESEGEFASTNFTSNVADLVVAAKYLAQSHGPAQIMIGHSLGGAATLAAAGEVPEAKAVCTIGAPADPAHVEHLFTERSAEIEKHGQAEVLLSGRPFVIQRQFIEDIKSSPLVDRVARLGKALLICHAPNDETVEVSNARRIYDAAKHPKSFLSLDGANHLLSRRKDAEYVAEMVAAWSSRYIGADEAHKPATDERERGEVVVEEAGGTGLAQLVVNGGHELVADEPVALGGGGAGPTPYGLLLAALGSCTTMTLRMYARRKKLPLKRARVRLTHSKEHVADFAKDGDGRLDVVERVLELEGDLDEGARASLTRIADRCPVHRTLTSRMDIRTTVKED